MAGKTVQEHGYYHRKMYMSIGSVHVGYFGELRGNSDTIVGFSYGHTNGDARCSIDVVVDGHLIPEKDFKARYGSGIKEEYQLLSAIRKEWIESIVDYVHITSNEEYDPLEKVFKSPFNVQAFLSRYRSECDAHATAPLATPQEIWDAIKDIDQRLVDVQVGERAGILAKEMVGERVRAFMRIFRFTAYVNYFIEGKWTLPILKGAMAALVQKYICSLVQPGDVVGTKATISITGQLAQATLHTSRGSNVLGRTLDTIRRVHGITPLREVTEKIKPKFPITSFYLEGEDKYNQAKCLSVARGISSVLLKEALIAGYFFSASPEYIEKGNCAGDIYLQWYKNLTPSARKVFDKSSHSWFYILLHINHISLLVNRVNPALVAPTLKCQFEDTIDAAIASYNNEGGMYVVLMYKATLDFDVMRTTFDEIIDTGIIHGHPRFTNGSVKPNEKFPTIGVVGSL